MADKPTTYANEKSNQLGGGYYMELLFLLKIQYKKTSIFIFLVLFHLN